MLFVYINAGNLFWGGRVGGEGGTGIMDFQRAGMASNKREGWNVS